MFSGITSFCKKVLHSITNHLLTKAGVKRGTVTSATKLVKVGMIKTQLAGNATVAFYQHWRSFFYLKDEYKRQKKTKKTYGTSVKK